MKKITLKIAEELALKKFNEIASEEDRVFSIEHTKAVIQAALVLSQGKKVNQELLQIAGWLHDIGKVISMEDHAKHSLEILTSEGFDIDSKLKDCILNHGSSGNPQTEEGRIFKIADKACFLNKDILDVLVKYSLKKEKSEKDKDLEFIRKMINGAVDYLRDYS